MHRFQIYRYDPDNGVAPHMQSYDLNRTLTSELAAEQAWVQVLCLYSGQSVAM